MIRVDTDMGPLKGPQLLITVLLLCSHSTLAVFWFVVGSRLKEALKARDYMGRTQ